MTIQELATAVGGALLTAQFQDNTYHAVKIDHRLVEKDDVFIAIIGETHDGHAFIPGAIQNGASVIICSEDVPMEEDISYIKVDNTTQALLNLGHYYRELHPIPLVAITGSVGKTTTKELTALILQKKYRVLKNEKNYNNEIGVPLTLLQLDDSHEIAVIEMGMNHFGELHRISMACEPTLGAMTIIGTSHIGNLGSQENILKAKCEMLDGMKKKELIINGDDPFLNQIDVPSMKCGLKEDNELRAENVVTSLEQTSFDIVYEGKTYPASISLPSHVLTNVLIAIRIGLYYGVSMEDIIAALAEYHSIDMRLNLIPIQNRNTIIDDCYNASFESMKGILSILKNDTRNKLLVLGEIFELGTFRDSLHEKLISYIKDVPNSKVILVGEGMKAVCLEDAVHLDSAEDVITYLKDCSFQDTLILLKGSRGVHLEKVKEYLINH